LAPTPARLDVGELDGQVALLFRYVSDGLSAATSTLLSGDRAGAHDVASTDRHIDSLAAKTEERATKPLL
jgi:hypothetical protein